MSQFFISKQAAEFCSTTKVRIDKIDNAAIATTALIQRWGPTKAVDPKFRMMAFESFVEAGIRRGAVAETLKWLEEHSHLQSDGPASNPKMPKHKRKNRGPNRSNGYRLHLPGGPSDFIPYELQSKAAIKRFAEVPTKPPCVNLRNELTPTQQSLAMKLLQIDVDSDAVRQILQLPKLSTVEVEYLRVQAERIQQKQHYAKQCKTGRLVTSVTGFPKILRPAMRISGAPLAEIDAGCCNYVLCCHFMREAVGICSKEFYWFQAMTETARIYDVIARDIGTDRDTVKTATLSYLAGPHNFGIERWQRSVMEVSSWKDRCLISNEYARLCEVERWFRSVLPTIDQFIRSWKQPVGSMEDHWKAESKRQSSNGPKGPHSVVSRTLQKLEADIFIESCAANLISKYPDEVFTTIHDCLLVRQQFVEPARAELMKSFAKLNLFPKLKVTPLMIL